jgi:glycosyltransferase involved in cell wall biosynthesis
MDEDVGRTALPFSVSVVIPLFNKEAAIERTIGSVVQQSSEPNELIIVDDGSSDNSRAVAEQTLLGSSVKFPWRIIRQENAGVSAARNHGADQSRSRFIAFLDADDEWLPKHLAEIERLAVAFPSAAVFSTATLMSDAAGRYVREPTGLPERFFGLLDRPLVRFRKGRGLINSSSIAIRRDAWNRAGGFPRGSHCGEDIFLWLKLGMSETFAHSGAALAKVHAEHSTGESRAELIGHQFSYFLGTPEGRSYLGNPDLMDFLSSHLLSQIAWRRRMRHSQVNTKLRRLARALPMVAALKCHLASFVPRWSLEAAVSLNNRLSGRRISSVGSSTHPAGN